MIQSLIFAFVLVALVLLIIALYNVVKYLFFPNLKIVGDSMLPVLADGELYSSKRVFFKKHYNYRIGRIYVFRSEHEDGEDVIAIKRLKNIDPNSGYLWFEGDNSAVSYDSRMYGYVSPSSVIAELKTRVR